MYKIDFILKSELLFVLVIYITHKFLDLNNMKVWNT